MFLDSTNICFIKLCRGKSAILRRLILIWVVTTDNVLMSKISTEKRNPIVFNCFFNIVLGNSQIEISASGKHAKNVWTMFLSLPQVTKKTVCRNNNWMPFFFPFKKIEYFFGGSMYALNWYGVNVMFSPHIVCVCLDSLKVCYINRWWLEEAIHPEAEAFRIHASFSWICFSHIGKWSANIE